MSLYLMRGWSYGGCELKGPLLKEPEGREGRAMGERRPVARRTDPRPPIASDRLIASRGWGATERESSIGGKAQWETPALSELILPYLAKLQRYICLF